MHISPNIQQVYKSLHSFNGISSCPSVSLVSVNTNDYFCISSLLSLHPLAMSLRFPPQKRLHPPSVMDRICKQLQLIYYRYEVTFCAYVLTPGEKLVLNSLVVLFFSLLLLGVVTYLPPLAMRAANMLAWLCSSSQSNRIAGNCTLIIDDLEVGLVH